jgi:hypothetical protein
VPSDQLIARSLHDLGAAAWFGGSLMGVTGLHAASGAIHEPTDRARVASAGWQAWGPWRTSALALHVAGSVSLLWGNKGRLAGQQGAMTTNLAKVGVAVSALAADVYAGILGRRIAAHQPVEVTSALEPADRTPEEVAELQRKLRLVQWSVPVLTGANVVLGAKMGEQQRPANLASGLLGRLDPRQ